MICLDSNAVIAAINRRAPRLRRRLDQAFVDRVTVGLPAIVLFELWYGIYKSARVQANAAALAAFLAFEITPWPFDADDARQAGDIRTALERLGKPIGSYDLLIAAQARRRNAVLVTANRREFARVPGLKVEDWAAA
jgi:tRNA(fMet)-specific endonuclease VapC